VLFIHQIGQQQDHHELCLQGNKTDGFAIRYRN